MLNEQMLRILAAFQKFKKRNTIPKQNKTHCFDKERYISKSEGSNQNDSKQNKTTGIVINLGIIILYDHGQRSETVKMIQIGKLGFFNYISEVKYRNFLPLV